MKSEKSPQIKLFLTFFMRTYFYATVANALVMEPWRQVSVGDA